MTTRKADSKGRLSGFTPGGTYDVKTDANDVTIAEKSRLEWRGSVFQPAPQKALDYLRSFGIDPDLVHIDGHSAWGYERFLSNEDGTRAWEVHQGQPDFEHVQWPTGFSYDKFIRLSRGRDS